MAFIRKRGDKTWQITVYVGSHIDEHGRRVRDRVTETFHGTYQDAQRRAAELELQARGASGLKDPAKRTFGLAAGEWLADIKPRLRPPTWGRYEEILRVYALPLWKDMPLVKLSPDDIAAAYSSLEPSKAFKLHAVLRPFLRWCYRKRWLARNPLEWVEPPR